jgi:hypothetical protein
VDGERQAWGVVRAAGPAAGPDGPAADGRPTLRADIAEGVRRLLGHRILRTICRILAIENIVEMAGFAMLARPTGPLHRRRGRPPGPGRAGLAAARGRFVRGRPHGGEPVPRSGSGLTGRPGIAATLPRSRAGTPVGLGGVAQR